MSNNLISHTGIIDSISEGNVKVRIVQSSACSGCKIASHCTSAESKEKIIDVYINETTSYTIGQQVEVIASVGVGFRAVTYGFIIPTIILVTTIIVCLKYLGQSEGVSALMGILSLIPYYLILFLLKDKMKRTMLFYIKEQD